MMKIAFIVKHFPSLSETFILNQITGLLDRGHEVDIFYRNRTNESVVHPDVERYDLLNHTHYLTAPPNKFIRILKSIGMISGGLFQNPKAILGALNIFKSGTSALSLYLLYITAPFLKGYDIIHCQFGDIGNFGAFLKGLGDKGKLVTTFHGYDTRLGVEEGAHIYSTLSKIGDCFIAVSEYNYESMIKFGFAKEKIVRHPLGIDTNKFSNGNIKKLAQDNKRIKILTIGRLVKEKGIEYGIRAFRKLLQQCPGIHLEYNIVGDGPLKEDLLDLTQRLDLCNDVHFLGSLNQDQIINVLQQNHIFLLPSVEESFGLVLLEAQAAELPVVVSSVGSTHEAMSDGKSGFLVPPMNIDSITDRLKFLVEHPQRCSEMGLTGRKYVEKNYDINKLNDRLVEIYQGLLN